MKYLDVWMQNDVALADQLTDELMTLGVVQHVPGMTVEPDTAGQKQFVREIIANPDFRIQSAPSTQSVARTTGHAPTGAARIEARSPCTGP